MMRIPFVVSDVFTDRRYGGNPLAVVLNAQGLATEQMQQIAREFNYSETTFVLPPERGGDYRVRIFTTTTEFPFAGHPNIGTAIVLAEQGLLPDSGRFVFEELAGDVPVTVQRADNGSWQAELRAPEALSKGQTFSAELISQVLSLPCDDIVVSQHQPMAISVGLPFIAVQLRHVEALRKAKVNSVALEALLTESESPFLHVYAHSDDEVDIRCRMFAPTDGVPEDPATGSANCALAALLADLDTRGNHEYCWTIAQGVEMGRPSELRARVIKQHNQVCDVYIGGGAVVFSQGEIHHE
ncbi:PhzF family phenazine biosynthesis protein [Reinekea sp. G2M2-21]|uniref:PhzF family phenazine biosynthesis protein n=1 Tax=Reinekea sp. G2M2-21 TaxID=2788942 RepID=UPI001E28977D|nr:PhzF family phenazine biosynthesis protein [Reinekea sp. G2M2-21]